MPFSYTVFTVSFSWAGFWNRKQADSGSNHSSANFLDLDKFTGFSGPQSLLFICKVEMKRILIPWGC